MLLDPLLQLLPAAHHRLYIEQASRKYVRGRASRRAGWPVAEAPAARGRGPSERAAAVSPPRRAPPPPAPPAGAPSAGWPQARRRLRRENPPLSATVPAPPPANGHAAPGFSQGTCRYPCPKSPHDPPVSNVPRLAARVRPRGRPPQPARTRASPPRSTARQPDSDTHKHAPHTRLYTAW